jgi:hypothetical protein
MLHQNTNDDRRDSKDKGARQFELEVIHEDVTERDDGHSPLLQMPKVSPLIDDI